MHWTSPYRDPLSLYRTLLLVTSCGQDWRPVQTCSLDDPHPASLPPSLESGAKTVDLSKLVHLRNPVVLTPSGWLLKHIQWASGWYAFKWNPFLFRVVFRFLKVMQELLDHGAYVDSYAINE